jgi:magnesium chelatase family protein
MTLPARFQLVAAMNPCPCGGGSAPDTGCRCPVGVPDRYAGRVSGPLRDRIDLWVEMPPVPQAQLVGPGSAESSEVVAARIAAARAMAVGRGRVANARLEGARLRSACRLTQHDEALVASISAAAGLSARGVGRLLRVARTFADLDGARNVGHEHLEEAARYRVPTGPYAGQLAS